MDILTTAERSERMRLVRGKHTKPELIVRRLLHSLGYRFRLHRTDLPGKPDLVFAGKRKVVLGNIWIVTKAVEENWCSPQSFPLG